MHQLDFDFEVLGNSVHDIGYGALQLPFFDISIRTLIDHNGAGEFLFVLKIFALLFGERQREAMRL